MAIITHEWVLTTSLLSKGLLYFGGVDSLLILKVLLDIDFVNVQGVQEGMDLYLFGAAVLFPLNNDFEAAEVVSIW